MLRQLQTKKFQTLLTLALGSFLTACQPQTLISVNTAGPQTNSSLKYAARATTAWSTCTTNSFQQAQNYNVFVLGNATQPSSDTQGRSAIGGNAYISNYSVGDQLTADPSRIDLLVGGNLEFPSGAVMMGRTVYGGTLTKTDAATSLGGFAQEDHSAEFATATTALKNLSSDLGSMQINGEATMDFTGGARSFTYLSGTNSTSNVVAIGTDDLEKTHTLTITAPAGSTMLINVYGEEAVFAALEMKLVGITRDHVVFNFVDAKNLYITNISIEASVLAPLANVTFAAGQLNGQFVGGSLYGQGQFNHDPFEGCVPVKDTPPGPTGPLCGGENTWANFNAITFGNFTQSGSDTEGRLAVGGIATLNSYAIGLQLSPDANRYDLIAGTVQFSSGSIYKGSVAYTNSSTITNATVYGSVVQNANALNFSQVQTQTQTQSQTLAALPTTGTTTVQYWGGPTAQITLTGNHATQNVFTINGNDLSHANSLNLNISSPSTATVIINVTGTNVSMNAFGFSLNGVQRSKVLFNFPQATNLQISNIGIEGSILSPLAAVHFQSGQFNGTLVANSVTGNGQFNHAPFLGCVP